MPQGVQPIRALETQDGNAVRPDVQLDPVHPFGPIDPVSRAAVRPGVSDACILSPLETIRRCEVSLRSNMYDPPDSSVPMPARMFGRCQGVRTV
jgi:hypothetical protein